MIVYIQKFDFEISKLILVNKILKPPFYLRNPRQFVQAEIMELEISSVFLSWKLNLAFFACSK